MNNIFYLIFFVKINKKRNIPDKQTIAISGITRMVICAADMLVVS